MAPFTVMEARVRGIRDRYTELRDAYERHDLDEFARLVEDE